jgi:hypothetical protein
LPYANHVIRLPPSLSTLSAEEREQALADAFLSVLDLAIATIRHDSSYPAGPPSYNVLLTLEHVHLIPRRQENATLTQTNDPLSINSMGFAGYMLVKSDEELEAVRSQVSSSLSHRGEALTLRFRDYLRSCAALHCRVLMTYWWLGLLMTRLTNWRHESSSRLLTHNGRAAEALRE